MPVWFRKNTADTLLWAVGVSLIPGLPPTLELRDIHPSTASAGNNERTWRGDSTKLIEPLRFGKTAELSRAHRRTVRTGRSANARQGRIYLPEPRLQLSEALSAQEFHPYYWAIR